MKNLILALLFALPLLAAADEGDTSVRYDLMINGLAAHTSSTFDGEKLNGFNPGIGLRISGGILDEDGAFSVGNYLNSFRRETVFALYEYTPYHYKRLDFGVFGGVVTGYHSDEDAIDPLVAGVMTNVHLTDRAGLQVRFIPGNVSVFTFNVVYQLGK